MDPIQAGSQNIGQSIQAANTGSIASTNIASSSAEISSTTTSVSISSSSNMTMSTLTQQIGAFLESISPELVDNQYLKLLIAAMIMQALLGEDGGAQQTGQAGMQALEFLSSSSQAVQMSVQSSTSVVQMQQQSAAVYSSNAVQATADTSESAGQHPAGGQMDISA